jgi:hypothetical protein
MGRRHHQRPRGSASGREATSERGIRYMICTTIERHPRRVSAVPIGTAKVMARLAKWLGWARGLTVVGLMFTLIGALFGVAGVWVNETGAIELGQSQGSAALSFGLIGLGTFLQIVGVLITPRALWPGTSSCQRSRPRARRHPRSAIPRGDDPADTGGGGDCSKCRARA